MSLSNDLSPEGTEMAGEATNDLSSSEADE